MNSDASTYLFSIREALPRVLSMLDRESFSKSFGCADRVFWSWKFNDFSGARFQEIAFILAELVVNPTAYLQNSYQQETLLAWTKAAIHYWRKLQHKDGSFDEAYPYERSLAATAFTGFYIGQAFLKIKYTYSQIEQNELIRVFESLGNWLNCNDEQHGILSNHLAAAAAALDTVAEITEKNHFIKRRDYFVNKIMSYQSEEGWYEEYGGADPGYQSHTTFYLAFIWMRTQNSALLKSLEKSIQYFWNFVHVDGSIGGEYASRNTRFFMPAGFEMLAPYITEAASVVSFMRISLQNQQAVGLHAMDAYNIFPLINNYAFAFNFASDLNNQMLIPLPFHTLGVTRYEKSGHLILSTPKYQAIIGIAKGGVIHAFSKEHAWQQWSNAGVALEFANKRKVSSQGLQCSQIKHIAIDDGSMTIESQFIDINQILMSPSKFIAFRLINTLSILWPSFAYNLKNLLVKTLVRRKKRCPARLLRKITWDENAISVQDNIILDKPISVSQIYIGGRFSAIHMGSSKYFEWQELMHQVMSTSLSFQQISVLNITGKLMLNNTWSAT